MSHGSSASDPNPEAELQRRRQDTRAIQEALSSSLPVDWSAGVSQAAQVSDVDWSARSRPSAEQQAHDREIERTREAQRIWEQRHNWWLLVSAAAVGAALLAAIHFGNTDPEIRKNSLAGIVAIFTTVIGFVAGRAGKT